MRWLKTILLALLAAVPASADEIRPFSIEFIEKDNGVWSLNWKQPVSPLNGSQLLVPQVPASCSATSDPTTRRLNLAILAQADYSCFGEIYGGSIGLPQLLGSAEALVRVIPINANVQTYRLTSRQNSVIILRDPGTLQVFWTYLVIGTEHILFGWDHLLFVIALVLLVKTGWSIFKAATAFTIAHSITLVASTLGYAGIPQGPVEALIALSILFLAVELAKPKQDTWTRRWPWVVAFGFGLLHGFGFAGALSEIGLPQGEVPAALVSFNIGVEIGQLLIVALVMGLKIILNSWSTRAERNFLMAVTYLIGVTGAYWFIDRVIV